jgi:hypothetical protein
MAQMGHTTAESTLSIYAPQMDRRDGEPERLRGLVEGHGNTIAAAGFGSELVASPEKAANVR